MKDLYKIATGFKQPMSSIRVRFGSVVSVQAGRTATVTIGGSTEQISGIPYLESMVPQPGKPVVMLTDGIDLFIVDHLSGGSMSLSPRAHRSSDLTVTTATDTVVPWTDVAVDPWGCWSAGNASRLTAPVDGRYMAVGTVQWAANATGNRSVWIENQAATQLARTQVPATATLATWLQVVTPPFDLVKGEWIQMYVRQNSGGNLAVTRDSTWTPSLSLIYLG